ncbi:latexin isoform X2 [Danio rerio]|uniref:Latexin isoform X2 n=4 Tax=Danio rerio TaxID=7955 RepID=A0ACD6B7R9_DANRE
MKTVCWTSALVFTLLQLTAALPCVPADPARTHNQTELEMATGELVPTHFPARRAAKVAVHYLNTRHGSPFRVFGLQQVHKATAEDVDAGGRKYSLDFSATEWARSKSVFRCSAVVLFSTAQKTPPDVQLQCEDLQQINTTPQEEAFYHRYSTSDSPVSALDIPDSHGNMSQEMEPFWHLAGVSASFIMLRESSENTEFNMAQVASVTQQETSEKQLMLKYHLLLHDFVSQEILHWQLLSSWSPERGVRVLETQFLPKCPQATGPPSSTPDQ